MKAYVLGTGPSLKNYIPDFTPTFGVNLIFKYHPVDFLVVLDQLIYAGRDARFVMDSNPEKLFHPRALKHDPIASHPKAVPFDSFLFEYQPSLEGLFEGMIPVFYHAVFAAVAIAYHQGFREIILFGVDFGKDYNKCISDKKLLKGWKKLADLIAENGGSLKLYSKEGILAKVLESEC